MAPFGWMPAGPLMVVLVLSEPLNADCVPAILDGRFPAAALASHRPVAGPVQESLVFSSIWWLATAGGKAAC